MPGKKKAKGKGGKKKEGGDGKLPPPPNLEQTRQGALEALLKFRISGREETIEQVEEETETYKDKNQHLKEKNHYLKIQRSEHYKSLVKQAKEQEEVLEKSPRVEKSSVDQALTEKIRLTQALKDDLEECKESIGNIDGLLNVKSRELETWIHFRDVTQDKNSARIEAIKERMEEMASESAILQSDYDMKLTEAEIAIDKKTAVLLEREKGRVTEQFLLTMDESTKAELSDNAWLKQEIATTKSIVEKLRREVNYLEHRNLKTIETITNERTADIENTREIYLATNRKSLALPSEGLKQAGDRSGLPSLVNVAQCTSEQGPGGQAGVLEMKLLSLQGRKAPVIVPPDMFHLPPLEQQLTSQKTIPTKSLWPVSHSMLKSVAQ